MIMMVNIYLYLPDSIFFTFTVFKQWKIYEMNIIIIPGGLLRQPASSGAGHQVPITWHLRVLKLSFFAIIETLKIEVPDELPVGAQKGMSMVRAHCPASRRGGRGRTNL